MKGPDGVVSGVYDPSSNTPGHVVFDKKQDRDPHGSGKVHESTPNQTEEQLRIRQLGATIDFRDCSSNRRQTHELYLLSF